MPTSERRHFLAYYRRYWALISVFWLVMVPQVSRQTPDEHLTRILQKDFITVHTRTTPTTYYEGRQGPTGFEYELMHQFAEHLGVSLNLNARHAPEEVLDAVREQGDMGASALPLYPDTPGIHYSRPIIEMQPLVVYRRGLNGINAVEDLVDLKVGTLRATGTERTLETLAADVAGLDWHAFREIEIAELLAMVE
ncbi:transporter substrate-binding domain-containing protein, partial [Halomonas sp. 707D7]|uniref:transporter substrate-binding domain-containing protein n=1 Tax=Halomonas sp. 707D7 TaxID=1681044 RepID=UPI0020A0514D